MRQPPRAMPTRPGNRRQCESFRCELGRPCWHSNIAASPQSWTTESARSKTTLVQIVQACQRPMMISVPNNTEYFYNNDWVVREKRKICVAIDAEHTGVALQKTYKNYSYKWRTNGFFTRTRIRSRSRRGSAGGCRSVRETGRHSAGCSGQRGQRRSIVRAAFRRVRAREVESFDFLRILM